MTFRMDQLVQVIAVALDAVEGELLGATTHHGKRIATLCAAMGRHLGLPQDELSTLTTCALLHDNALTEYILSERKGRLQEFNMRLHCLYGQRNVDALPLPSSPDELILYHHERADGTGPFEQPDGETPLGAQLIAIADKLDVEHALSDLSVDDLSRIRAQIETQTGSRFTPVAARAMLEVLTPDMAAALRDDAIRDTVARAIPRWEVQAGDAAMIHMASFVARIIDYKSHFTRRHSVQIANRAWFMSGFYGFEHGERARIYLAAALHDIGKLFTPTEILEKPGKLTPEEYAIIMEHVMHTYRLLTEVSGFEQLCTWASDHHEKLDGNGYPFGKTGDELDFVSRLLACIDIYQAVSEERPYHPARSHADTMPVLRAMAERGEIDAVIVADLGTAMAPFSLQDVPPPDIPGA